MKDAEKWEKNVREALELADAENRKDTHRVGREVLAGDWANAYMDYATATWSKGSCSDKRLAFRRLFEMTARPKQLVHEISPVVALNHLSRLSKQATGNTANRDRKQLAAAWKWGARYLGMDRTNPFRSVDKFPEQRHPRWVPPLEDFRMVADAATPLQQQLLRHKSIATTQRYIHKIKKSTGAVDALDAVWRGNGGRKPPVLKLV
ncbi:MAG: site-specific integrase, partial [Pseudomonadota bacterium]